MVVKSHGPRRRTREKLRGPKRPTISEIFKEFSPGDRVVLKIRSSSGSIPCRRFHGLSGKILGKRGRAYIIEIKDGKKIKKVIAMPEHLKAV